MGERGVVHADLEHRKTLAPSLASLSAVALPIPAVAAVTIATLPSSLLHLMLLAMMQDRDAEGL